MQFWNIVKIIALIIVLALLGFNIFTYLAKGTDVFGKYLGFAEKKIEKGRKETQKGADEQDKKGESKTQQVLQKSSSRTGNIDKIEITKGPTSALYGSEAMVGVINIITNTDVNNNSINFSTIMIPFRAG